MMHGMLTMSDLISRQAVKDWLLRWKGYIDKDIIARMQCRVIDIPPAQPYIKQAAKLLSDFIESCPGGDSYLITPDGEELRTDWGYAMEGIQLIYDWAERRIDAL